MIESIGDYYACARIYGVPPPAEHVMNIGIGIEGVGSQLAGMWVFGMEATSQSENIGAIGITKVCSFICIELNVFTICLYEELHSFLFEGAVLMR